MTTLVLDKVGYSWCFETGLTQRAEIETATNIMEVADARPPEISANAQVASAGTTWTVYLTKPRDMEPHTEWED